MRIECEHIETGAKGFIIQELEGTKDFPGQYGIYWKEGVNNYYWNDKNKIKQINTKTKNVKLC